MTNRPYAVGTICIQPGVHEMECRLNQRDVKIMLDQFYNAVDKYNIRYTILGTSTRTVGGRLRKYIVRYNVTG